jgi:hypothetical protein
VLPFDSLPDPPGNDEQQSLAPVPDPPGNDEQQSLAPVPDPPGNDEQQSLAMLARRTDVVVFALLTYHRVTPVGDIDFVITSG